MTTEAVAHDELDPVRRKRMVIGAAVAGLAAGWLAPSSTGPGLFIPLIAAFGAASVAMGGGLSRNPWSRAYLGMSAALALTPLVWAAEWMAALATMGACGFAALAMREPTTWASFVKAATGPLGRLPLTPSFAAKTFLGHRKEGSRIGGVVKGAAIAVPLVLMFGALFASADAVFANTVDRVFTLDLGELPGRLAVAVFGTALTLAFAMSSSNLKHLWPSPVFLGDYGPLFDRAEDGRPIARLGPTEWTIALVSLDLLFAAFVGIQVTVLFAGREHVLTTAGLTYAEYARSGFFQLVVSAGLTLAIVAGARFWCRTDSTRMVRRLNLLLVVLCTMTLVILASAFKRMGLYEQEYGYTRPRYVAYTVIFWLAGIFIMTMVTQLAGWDRWLPRIAALFTGITFVTAAAIGPDRFIADANVDQFARTGSVDTIYLATLSPDALPAIDRLPETLRRCPVEAIAARYREDDHWGSFNLSRSRWRSHLKREFPEGSRDPWDCASEPVSPG